MTSSLIGADQGTHGKIVGTALVAALLFVAVGFWAHLNDAASSGRPAVVKASTPTTYTSHDGVVVR
jgi:hypothetical protein